MNTRLTLACLLTAALSLTTAATLTASDQGPTPISQRVPNYAWDLRRAEAEGSVVVAYTVTAQGDVTNAGIVSSTDKAFERATLAAIRQWKFKPAMKDGVAVSTSMRTTVNFVLPYLHPEGATAIAKAAPAPQPSQASNAPGQ